MAGDAMKKVAGGDPLEVSARAWNTFIDSAAWVQGERIAQRGRPALDILGAQRTIIHVQNGSPGNRDRFDVLALSGPILDVGTDEFQEFPRLVGTTPAKGSSEARFAVLLEPVELLGVGRACVAGVTVARVDVQEEWHQWADIKDQEHGHLESVAQPAGAQILYKETGKGVKWAIIRLGPPQPDGFWAKITAVQWLTAGRYKYTFAEVEKTDALHDGWTVKSEGRGGFAYNSIETVGTAAEVEPARVGEIVWVREEAYTDEGGQKQTEYWFQYEERSKQPSEPSQPSQPSEPGVQACVLTCGPIDQDGCYVVTERTFTFPAGTTWTDGPTRRLMMCSGSPSSQPSLPAAPLLAAQPWQDWRVGAEGWVKARELPDGYTAIPPQFAPRPGDVQRTPAFPVEDFL